MTTMLVQQGSQHIDFGVDVGGIGIDFEFSHYIIISFVALLRDAYYFAAKRWWTWGNGCSFL
jgi:hypothetical protein